MTCFFILSGFSIHFQHREEELCEVWIRQYLKKRWISIMPSYLLVALIWPLVYPAQVKDWLVLLPADLVGIQTAYRTLFGILHNGGSWFVSCMLFAYMTYIVLKAALGSQRRWVPGLMLFGVHFLLMYSNILIARFGLDGLYSNPIARAAEFALGSIFAELLFREGKKINDHNLEVKSKTYPGVPGVSRSAWMILVLIAASLVIARIAHVGKHVIVYGYLVSPAVLFLLLLSSLVRSKVLENSRVLSALSGMSYQFFLAQLFLWKLTAYVLDRFALSGNKTKIGVSLILCTLLSYVVWKYYDKPVRKALRRKLFAS